jgi:hypothetical protein
MMYKVYQFPANFARFERLCDTIEKVSLNM